MVLHNPNNWHWVNKDVAPWAKQWLESQVTNVSAEEENVSAKISKLVSMDGDVDVSQRKGKVGTLFDVAIQLEYEGKIEDGPDVSGSIKIPECAHDTKFEEYVFDIDVIAESKEKQPVKDLVRSKLVPQLRQIFQKLEPALIEEHGRGLQHAPESNPSSGFATPTWHPQRERTPIPSTTTRTASSKEKSSVNTKTVNDTHDFGTTAENMYKAFTDEQVLKRSIGGTLRGFEGAKVGGEFSIFDGNVTGEFVTLDKPKKIVQKWRLSHWPEGHMSTQEILFDQNDVDHVTNMKLTWSDIPVGQETDALLKWQSRYINHLKTDLSSGTIF